MPSHMLTGLCLRFRHEENFAVHSSMQFHLPSPFCRIVSRLVFLASTESVHIIRKLDQLFAIRTDLVGCLDMMNTNHTIQLYAMILFSSMTMLSGAYAKIR